VKKLIKDKSASWNNNNNSEYYEAIPLEELPTYAKLGGLDTGCDIEIIASYIQKASSILEIGAGYGRVIKKLKEINYKNKLVVLERSKQFISVLQENYCKDISIVKEGIQDFSSKEKFDLILWLWSGFCDFSKKEQPFILEKTVSLLSNKGVLVLDTMPPNLTPKNATILQDQSYIIPSSNNSECSLYGYVPSNEELDEYVKILNLKIKHIPYFTTTNRERVLHIIHG